MAARDGVKKGPTNLVIDKRPIEMLKMLSGMSPLNATLKALNNQF